MTVAYTQITDEDRGIDGPLRTLKETQGTPQLDLNTSASAGTGLNPRLTAGTGINFETTTGITAAPFSRGGQGAPSEDQTDGLNSRAGVNQTVNQSFNSPIVQQPNVLDQYASYTYNIGWYLLSEDQWNQMSDGKVNTNTWTLLMQSGGAQAGAVDSGQGGRSKYFTTDYYMDNIILTTNMPGGGIGSTLNSNLNASVEFTVTEPNGITLANNLAGAVRDLYGTQAVDGNEPWLKVPQCLVVRFYGYDNNGNLVQAGKNNNQNGTQAAGPANAIVTKYIPFFVDTFHWRIASRIIEYKITGKCATYSLLASSRRGSIPQQFELVGKTVGAILSGTQSGPQSVTVGFNDGRKEQAQVKTAPSAAILENRQATGLSTDQGVDFTAGNF